MCGVLSSINIYVYVPKRRLDAKSMWLINLSHNIENSVNAIMLKS